MTVDQAKVWVKNKSNQDEVVREFFNEQREIPRAEARG